MATYQQLLSSRKRPIDLEEELYAFCALSENENESSGQTSIGKRLTRVTWIFSDELTQEGDWKMGVMKLKWIKLGWLHQRSLRSKNGYG